MSTLNINLKKMANIKKNMQQKKLIINLSSNFKQSNSSLVSPNQIMRHKIFPFQILPDK